MALGVACPRTMKVMRALDLTAGPMVRLPSGGHMHLFLALPLGALPGPATNAG